MCVAAAVVGAMIVTVVVAVRVITTVGVAVVVVVLGPGFVRPRVSLGRGATIPVVRWQAVVGVLVDGEDGVWRIGRPSPRREERGREILARH